MARYLSIQSVTTMLSRLWAQFVSNGFLIDAAPDRKYYEILLTQVGTSTPTAVIAKNTTGVVPTLARTGQGVYTITSTGLFTSGKTLITHSAGDLTAENFIDVQRTSANVLTIRQLQNSSGTLYQEDAFSNVTIKVEILN